LSFTAFMAERLARLGIPAKCSVCGNTSLDELAMSLTGQLHCRQDEENIRANCRKRIGWRVLDAGGRVINTGPGITLRASGNMNG
jgi:hypothetical protein